MHSILISLTLIMLLSACGTPIKKRATLGDHDLNLSHASANGTNQVPKSSDDIRKAYAIYLEHASKDEKLRVDALSRLAALEFELSEQMLKNKYEQNIDAVETADDKLYIAKLDRTIELLTTALRDYPNAKNSDKRLYQLAKVYDQKGGLENSYAALKQLVQNHPKSKYYYESQFRLAEASFSKKQYLTAEDKYTDVISSKKRNLFFEKALYKRGWSRFKQDFYFESIDDYLQAVKLNEFDDYQKLSDSNKSLFDEYFRAIGLSFSYMGGAKSLGNYFQEIPHFEQLYYIYSHLTETYLIEERMNDAVNTLKHFAKSNPDSDHVPEALLKVLNIWKLGDFPSRMNAELEAFYVTYQPDSEYWSSRKSIDQRIYKLVKRSLRDYILAIAANYRHKYMENKKEHDYSNAIRWYDNYLKHYSSYSRKDNINYLYASLLSEHKDYGDALKYFELAAFDSNIIIDKHSAYDSILLASKLSGLEGTETSAMRWIEKLIHFSTLYAEQYSNDKRTAGIIAHASEVAYKNRLFNKTIMLTERATNHVSRTMAEKISTIKAHSYFQLGRYEDAENIYRVLLKDYDFSKKRGSSITNNLALAIYNQGESAKNKSDVSTALQHFSRVSSVVPGSEIAEIGMYDAILLAMKNNLWGESIKYIKAFQRLYPHHKNAYDVAKKLPVAYLNSKQDVPAARELEKLAGFKSDEAYSRAALWKAGELYESNKDYKSAIRSFKKFANNFHRPFSEYMKSMFKLVNLYKLTDEPAKANFWQKTIVLADKKAPNSSRSEQTQFIASSAYLHQARKSHRDFTNAKLRIPLKRSLKKKKTAMQQAVNLYGRASSYSVSETKTEAEHSIAEIFNQLSIALLESERPKELNEDELEQYEILLEDLAFPFEEKAIEFYQINLTNVKSGVYDEWIQKSHAQLKKLFPVRFERKAKIDESINVLH